MPEQPQPGTRRQVRLATIVIVVAVVAWFGASALGGWLGLPLRWAFLIDMAAMAALLWALIVVLRAWRAGQGNGV